MDIIWGLFLFSLTSGIGFDQSHSLTDLNETYFSVEKCAQVAMELNSFPFNQKQIGLNRNVVMKYVCIAKPKLGNNI